MSDATEHDDSESNGTSNDASFVSQSSSDSFGPIPVGPQADLYAICIVANGGEEASSNGGPAPIEGVGIVTPIPPAVLTSRGDGAQGAAQSAVDSVEGTLYSLVYIKLLSCFFTGIGTSDLLIAWVFIQFQKERMQLFYGAAALVIVNAALLMGNLIISQTTLRGTLPILFGSLAAAGWMVLVVFPTCEPLFVVAALFSGLGQQLGYMQRVAGQIGENRILEKKSQSWMWACYLAGNSIALPASGVLYSAVGFRGVALMGGLGNIGATMSTAAFVLLSAMKRNEAALKRAADAGLTIATEIKCQLTLIPDSVAPTQGLPPSAPHPVELQRFPSKLMHAGTMLSLFSASIALSAMFSGCFVRWQLEFGIAPTLSGICLCTAEFLCFAITFFPSACPQYAACLVKVLLLKNPLDMTWANACVMVGMGLYSVNVGPVSMLGGMLVLLGYCMGVSAANKTMFVYVPSKLVAKHIVYGSGMNRLGQMVGCACTLLLSSDPATASVYLWSATAFASFTWLVVSVFTLRRAHFLAAELPRVSTRELLLGGSEFGKFELELSKMSGGDRKPKRELSGP